MSDRTSEEKLAYLQHAARNTLTVLESIVAEEAAEVRRNSWVAQNARSAMRELQEALKETE